MTEEQVEQWKVEREIAAKSGDQKLIDLAEEHRDQMMMHCIQRQADRIKKVSADNDEIKRDIADIKCRMTDIATSRAVLTEKYEAVTTSVLEMKNKVDAWQNQAKGAKWLWDILKVGVGAGGGAMILKALGAS